MRKHSDRNRDPRNTHQFAYGGFGTYEFTDTGAGYANPYQFAYGYTDTNRSTEGGRTYGSIRNC